MSVSRNLHLTPQEQLIKIMQDPHYAAIVNIPAYAAMAELSRRKEAKAAPQAQAAPTQSVAKQMLAEAEPGVASLPVPDDMYQEKSMAAGGIVNFAGGGDVSQADIDYAAWQRGDVVTPAFGRIVAPAYYGLGDLYGWAKGKKWVRDPATGKLVRASELEKPKVEKPNPNTPEGADAIRQQQTAAFLDKQAKENLADPQYIANVNKTNIMRDIAAGKYDTVPGGPNDNANIKPPRPQIPAADNTGLTSITAPKIQYDEAGYDQAMLPKRDAAEEAARWKAMVGENEGLAALQGRLSKMEEKAAAEEERAPWMALARAGLGMAAGKSQFALQNIAEGATAGLADYAASRDKLAAAEEKRFALQSQMAQAKRAEDIAAAKFGTDSEQYADTQNRLAKLHALDAKNTAKVHDAANELTAQRNAIEQQQGVWAHEDRIAANRTAAASAAKLSDYETYLQHAQQLPENWKVIKGKDGKETKVFDIDRAQSNYWNARGMSDLKGQGQRLTALQNALKTEYDPKKRDLITQQIQAIISGGDADAVSAVPGIAAPRAELFKPVR